MPSLIDIRRRIRSVKNTQQITRAMKMVASAKLRKAQDRVLMSRPYSKILGEMVVHVAAAAASDERLSSHPLLARREEKRIQLIFLTSDRGLAGAFNSNLIKAASGFLREHSGAGVETEAIGRKGRDFIRKSGQPMTGGHVGLIDKAKFEDVSPIAAKPQVDDFQGFHHSPLSPRKCASRVWLPVAGATTSVVATAVKNASSSP